MPKHLAFAQHHMTENRVVLPEEIRRQAESAIIFNCLIKFEDGLFVAHCLELGIVATGTTPDKARSELNDLIAAQMDYAFSNDNLENLYHPVPAHVWQEYFACIPQPEEKK